MGLRNSGSVDQLTVAQIAAHLGGSTWRVTYELQLDAAGQAGRLHGFRVFNDGPGQRGQWRVLRTDYLARLQIPAEDRAHVGPDGLPVLHPFAEVAGKLSMPVDQLKTLVRQGRWPHIMFGRSMYLTHHQLRRIAEAVADSDKQLYPQQVASAREVLATIYRE